MSEPLKCGPCKKCRGRAEFMSLKPYPNVSDQEDDISKQAPSNHVVDDVQAIRTVEPGTSGLQGNVKRGNNLFGFCLPEQPREMTQILYLL
jgi:hypothetical protein